MQSTTIILLCVFVSWLTAHSIIDYFTLDARVNGVRMAIFFFDDKQKFFGLQHFYPLLLNDQSPWLKSVL